MSEYAPAEPIPAADPLASYDGLRLGMSNLELAQAYNAPEGRGDGFTRGVEEFGDARNHMIRFDSTDTEPRRRIVVRIYRDELTKLVDRRDGLSVQAAQAWLDELRATYGSDAVETIGDAQWTWGSADGIQLVYTRDNAPTGGISANVVLVHHPSHDASVRYIEAWERENAGAAGS